MFYRQLIQQLWMSSHELRRPMIYRQLIQQSWMSSHEFLKVPLVGHSSFASAAGAEDEQSHAHPDETQSDLQLAAQSAAFLASNVNEECKQAASKHGMHKVSMGIIC
jgi:hypothetical protein